MTCPIPGVCSKSPACKDKQCPGFPTRRVHWPTSDVDEIYIESPLAVIVQTVLAFAFVACMALAFIHYLD